MAYNLLPWAIAALVAGTGAQMRANQQQRRALSQAYDNYAARTARRAAEASQLFEKSLGEQDIENQQARIDEAAAEKVQRVDDLVKRESYIDPLLPGQDRAPKVIKSQAAASLADEIARARAQIAALAKLEGFSTRTFDRGLELDHVKPLFGNIGLFSQGDQNIFQAESLGAQHKGQNLRLIGDLLVGLGALGLGAWGGAAAGGSQVISAANRPQATPYVNSSVRMV